MTREEYIKLFHEEPEDMFGEDWEEVLEQFTSDGTCNRCGGDKCEECGEGYI